ncbi:MAG TPA: nucleoside recognition domain-containing protein [Bacteroidia bacterium]|nr:nucleoside recognition domain-containing protein [Bacteroidia bacterium]HRS59821.1 nucleoside recognition domain-containing protein [Bacteroidia bacterium]
MILNYIWIAFFLIAFVVAIVKLLFLGDTGIFTALMNNAFSMAKTGFELSLGLTGIMTLWLGIMKIGEKGGAVNILARIVSPFFNKLFPEVPKNHPVHGSMLMNITANMLGLDNAATPLGLKAMNELQELNKDKDVASNSQIMFMILNASGLTVIPITIIIYRAQLGAMNPSDVFIPILISTFASVTTGIIVVSIIQKINLFNKVVLLYLGSIIAIIAGLLYYFSSLPDDKLNAYSSLLSNMLLFVIIISFISMALFKKVNVWESFIEGAKEGFNVAIKIIPFLVAILVGIGVFRASGAMEYFTDGVAWVFSSLGFNTDFVDALPTAFMKPLSGSGARGMMLETMKTFGPDSFAGRLSCIFQGTSDTTFYIIALYFGSIGIKKTRYALGAGLTADLIGMITAVWVAYLFFH